MPANGEERKIELIGTSGTPSPTVKSKKIPADRDVGDAVPYGKIEKNTGGPGRQHLVTFGVLRKDAVPYGKIEKRTPSPR